MPVASNISSFLLCRSKILTAGTFFTLMRIKTVSGNTRESHDSEHPKTTDSICMMQWQIKCSVWWVQVFICCLLVWTVWNANIRVWKRRYYVGFSLVGKRPSCCFEAWSIWLNVILTSTSNVIRSTLNLRLVTTSYFTRACQVKIPETVKRSTQSTNNFIVSFTCVTVTGGTGKNSSYQGGLWSNLVDTQNL